MLAKKALTAWLVVVAMVGLSACGSDDSDDNSNSSDGTSKVRFGMTGGTAASIPIDLADQQGIFKKNGISLDSISLTGSSMLPSFNSGDVDVAFMAPLMFSTSRQAGSDVTYFCGLIPTDWSHLVAKADSDVPVANGDGKATLESLVGKAIGVGSLGGGQESAVRTAFKASGVDLGKTTFVAVGVGPTAFAALKTGQVSAIVGSPPSMNASIASGEFKSVYKIADDSPEPLHSGFYAGFVAHSKWLKENPEAASGFCTSIKEALNFATDSANKATVSSYLDKTFSISDAAAVDSIIATDGPVAGMGTEMSCDTLQPTIDFLAEQKLIGDNPSLKCADQNLISIAK